MTYLFSSFLDIFALMLSFKAMRFKPRTHCAYVATVHPDTVMHRDTFHNK